MVTPYSQQGSAQVPVIQAVSKVANEKRARNTATTTRTGTLQADCLAEATDS